MKGFNTDNIVEKMLEDHSIRITETGCRIWMRCLDSSGYGLISFRKRQQRTHRVAWQLTHSKPIPAGMNVLHRCDVPMCCNPDHLFLGTQLDNIADRTKKRRGKNPIMYGAQNPGAILTKRQVIAIRNAKGTQRAIAGKYGVTQTLISLIKRNKLWKSI